MSRHFTTEETRAWQKTLPTKTMSSLCLFFDPAGRLLIVKPTYKPGWSMVGGIVDDQESPLAAMIRETKEEIGLGLTPDRFSFLLLKYKNRQSSSMTKVLFTNLAAGVCSDPEASKKWLCSSNNIIYILFNLYGP